MSNSVGLLPGITRSRSRRNAAQSLPAQPRRTALILTDHTAGGWFLDVPGDPGPLHAGPRNASAGAGRVDGPPQAAERCSYRGDVSGGAVTVTPNSAATYAANSSLVGRHPS